jgi:hypothetical protein
VTIREQLLSRPPAAQIVIRAYATKASLHDPKAEEKWDHYGAEAIAWWDSQLTELRTELGAYASETTLAEMVIEKLRKQDTWGRILRKGTN